MKTVRYVKLKKAGCFILAVLLIGAFTGSASAESTAIIETNQPDRLELVVGKSATLKTSESVKRVSIAEPEIADFILISPREIYLTGKSPGVTNLTLWQNKKVVAIYDLEVSYDVSGLKQKLNLILP